jgi:hypothetical protein
MVDTSGCSQIIVCLIVVAIIFCTQYSNFIAQLSRSIKQQQHAKLFRSALCVICFRAVSYTWSAFWGTMIVTGGIRTVVLYGNIVVGVYSDISVVIGNAVGLLPHVVDMFL